VGFVLYALLFVPALLAVAYVAVRARRPVAIVEEAAAPPNAFATLDNLLSELERLTLDERDVDELERLADELERTARELERVA
jgi:hypothetical protein